jgi:hypothetical protein
MIAQPSEQNVPRKLGRQGEKKMPSLELTDDEILLVRNLVTKFGVTFP